MPFLPLAFFRCSRRTYFSAARCFSRPYAFVFPAINRTPVRNAAFARLTSAAERRRQTNQTEIVQTTAVLLSFCVIRRTTSLFPARRIKQRKQKAHKKNVPEKRFSGTIPKSKIRLTSSPRQPASQLLRSGPRSSFPSLRPSRRTRNGSLSRPPPSECRQPSFCRP